MALFGKSKPTSQYDNLPFDVLLEKKVEIDTAIKRRGNNELDGFVSRFNALASSLGVSAGALFGFRDNSTERAPPTQKKKREMKPKYRNPANPEETWGGKGHAPQWLKTLIEAGRTKDEFLIGKD
ncbi:MAG: H-NS histone family protein [Alphaproteobacteria bacterium]|nr:MAG: H-NS histone family protein [Alphaproteobacteria bacterium]